MSSLLEHDCNIDHLDFTSDEISVIYLNIDPSTFCASSFVTGYFISFLDIPDFSEVLIINDFIVPTLSVCAVVCAVESTYEGVLYRYSYDPTNVKLLCDCL